LATDVNKIHSSVSENTFSSNFAPAPRRFPASGQNRNRAQKIPNPPRPLPGKMQIKLVTSRQKTGVSPLIRMKCHQNWQTRFWEKLCKVKVD
jgi:hypothetical protein